MDAGLDLSIDSNNDIWLAGYFGGGGYYGNKSSADFGDTILDSKGFYDIFTAKLSRNGEWLWANSAGGTGQDMGTSIDTFKNDYAVFTGHVQQAADFGGTAIGIEGWAGYLAKNRANGDWGYFNPTPQPPEYLPIEEIGNTALLYTENTDNSFWGYVRANPNNEDKIYQLTKADGSALQRADSKVSGAEVVNGINQIARIKEEDEKLTLQEYTKINSSPSFNSNVDGEWRFKEKIADYSFGSNGFYQAEGDFDQDFDQDGTIGDPSPPMPEPDYQVIEKVGNTSLLYTENQDGSVWGYAQPEDTTDFYQLTINGNPATPHNIKYVGAEIINGDNLVAREYPDSILIQTFKNKNEPPEYNNAIKGAWEFEASGDKYEFETTNFYNIENSFNQDFDGDGYIGDPDNQSGDNEPGVDIVGTDGRDNPGTYASSPEGRQFEGTYCGEYMFGLGGADVLYGHGGDDNLLGGAGGDEIKGGEGNDAIDGGEGNDRMWGNTGADIFILSEGLDTIYDFGPKDFVLAPSTLEGDIEFKDGGIHNGIQVINLHYSINGCACQTSLWTDAQVRVGYEYQKKLSEKIPKALRNNDDGHELIHTRHLKEIVFADSDPEGFIFDNPSELNSRYADIIIGFNHLEDELLLDQEVFDIDDSFKVKRTKIKSSPEESKASTTEKEFIYDKKLGGLYFNANGSEPGFGEDGGLIAEINGLKGLKGWQIADVIELY